MTEAHTPGPWSWFGNQHGVYLATPDRGRTYVMGFRRMGLQGAQPTFRDGGVMRPASELVRFSVGNGLAKGFSDGRADGSVYRYDISSIDHPDARLIAAAPDYHTAAREIDRLALVIESAVRFSDPTNLAAVRAALKANQAAILKATTPNAGERG